MLLKLGRFAREKTGCKLRAFTCVNREEQHPVSTVLNQVLGARSLIRLCVGNGLLIDWYDLTRQMQLATCVKAAPLQLVVRELFLASGLLDRRITPVDFNGERRGKRALKLNQDQVLGPFFIFGITSSPLTSF